MSRFAENPFNSRSSSPEATGSVKSAQSAPVSRVESKPLHGTQPPQTQPATASPRLSAAGGHSQRQDITGSIKSTPQYTWDGGTAVTAAQGETVESLALRYKVPEAALMQANGLSRNSVLKPGQRIVIPRRATAVPTIAAPATKPATTAPKASAGVTHVVAPGETLLGVSRRYNKTPREIAAANQLKYDQPLKIGDRIVIPGVAASKATTPIASAPAAAPQNVASAQPQTSARMHTPAAEAIEQTASANGAAPQFRWPVRGRVISGFGPMTNGQQNDGINLAVPEGTAVRAAEDGVVAYSGNELKGYGNLVLVRHNNGFVSAYAHASELMVKKGDTVRRGRAGTAAAFRNPQGFGPGRSHAVPAGRVASAPRRC
jgi:murein DD-endopeptidase MepM/ murein hydrolase activator NlpD